jgi:hypothetical protein
MSVPPSPRTAKLAVAALLLGMPCLAIGTMVNPVVQAGSIDPYIYTGLLHDFGQVLRRYGATYYANRVAFTVPARIAITCFGDAGGHFVFQTLYLFAATLSGFALGRRYFSTALGVAVAAWVAFNPWLIRTLAWDYIEGAAVCAMLVAFCCFGLNRHRPVLLHAAAGLAFALACNANPFVVAMAAAFAPAWLILNLPGGTRHCLACVAAALFAFVFGYAGLILVEYLELPELGFGRELVTLGVGMRLLGGGGAVWYRSVWDVLAEGDIYILVPAFLAAGLTILIAAERFVGRRIDRFTVAAATYLVLTCAAYLLFHDYFRTAVLTVYWYDGYAFPAGLFAVIALLGNCSRVLPARRATLLCTSAALCFALLWFGYSAWHALLGLMTVGAFGAIGGGLAVAMAGGRYAALRAASAFAGATMAIAIFYYPPDHGLPQMISPADLPNLSLKGNPYAALHDPARQVLEREMYQAAVFLQHAIAENLPIAEGPVGFWYGHEPEDSPFASIQSVFLNEYSSVVSPVLPHEPGAHLDAEQRQKLARFAHIAILSRTQAQSDAALQALGSEGAAVHLRARFAFPGPWFPFITTIVDYEPPLAPVGERVAVIATNALVAHDNASVVAAGDGIALDTAPQQWAYSAIAPLSSGGLPSGRLVLRLRLRVLRGQVGLMVATGDLSAPPITESGLGPTPEPRDVDLAIPDGAAAHVLIIRNWAPSGPSLVQVSGIAVFRAPP